MTPVVAANAAKVEKRTFVKISDPKTVLDHVMIAPIQIQCIFSYSSDQS